MTRITPRKTKRFGWRRQLPDPRDYAMKVVAPTTIPKTLDMTRTAFMPSIWDQGPIGSCVGHGVARGFEYELRRQHLFDFMPSRLAIYFDARKSEGDVSSDAGCEIRDAIKVIAKLGAGPETLWPYVPSKFAQQPPPAYYATAKSARCLSYEAVSQSEREIKTALAAGFLVVFGISVFDSFESDAVAKTGVVPMPKASESLLGGHCIAMCGYTTTRVRAANSWGSSWGMNGFFTLPLDYVLNPDLASDFWIIKVVE